MSRDSLGGEWGAPQQLVRNAWFSRWSPDGNHVLYRRGHGSGMGIVSLEGEERLLFDAAAAGFRRSDFPDWSVDGRFIYFTARDSTGARMLFAIPVEGGIPREVVRFDDPTRNVVLLYTLGDGKAYFTLKEIESDIYVMDLEMR
jgi:hypothetical protein